VALLHDRLVKAEFWASPDLLHWSAYKRWTYQGLWAIAEASGCLEDNPFDWKITLWRGPKDGSVTVEKLTVWRSEFIKQGKLVPYSVAGKLYLFCVNFHEHQNFSNPAAPEIPLPPWVRFEPFTSKPSQGRYFVDQTTLQRAMKHVGEQTSLFSEDLPEDFSEDFQRKGKERKGKELSEGPPVKPYERQDDAGTMTGYYVKSMEESGQIVITSDRTKFSKFAKEVLAAGASYPDCLVAVDKMVKKNLGAHLLGALVNEVSKQPGADKMREAKLAWLRGLYRQFGDEARASAKSDAEWNEALEGLNG
jgi:hypothetical protein